MLNVHCKWNSISKRAYRNGCTFVHCERIVWARPRVCGVVCWRTEIERKNRNRRWCYWAWLSIFTWSADSKCMNPVLLADQCVNWFFLHFVLLNFHIILWMCVFIFIFLRSFFHSHVCFSVGHCAFFCSFGFKRKRITFVSFSLLSSFSFMPDATRPFLAKSMMILRCFKIVNYCWFGFCCLFLLYVHTSSIELQNKKTHSSTWEAAEMGNWFRF